MDQISAQLAQVRGLTHHHYVIICLVLTFILIITHSPIISVHVSVSPDHVNNISSIQIVKKDDGVLSYLASDSEFALIKVL